jgi:putative hydrolase of the HAD superfamily
MIKLIAFDLWGTLAIKGNPFIHFSNIVKEEFELKISKDEIIKIYEESVEIKYWETEIDAYTEFARRLKISPTRENLLKIIAAREKIESDVIVFDFAIPLLKKLRKNGYKTAIVSNSSMFTYNELKRKTDLLDHFDYQFFSFQVGYLKPNPQIYLELQRKALVYNNEMLMIGDDFENDFKAPKILGINAIMFKNYDSLLQEFKKYDIKL